MVRYEPPKELPSTLLHHIRHCATYLTAIDGGLAVDIVGGTDGALLSPQELLQLLLLHVWFEAFIFYQDFTLQLIG